MAVKPTETPSEFSTDFMLMKAEPLLDLILASVSCWGKPACRATQCMLHISPSKGWHRWNKLITCCEHSLPYRNRLEISFLSTLFGVTLVQILHSCSCTLQRLWNCSAWTDPSQLRWVRLHLLQDFHVHQPSCAGQKRLSNAFSEVRGDAFCLLPRGLLSSGNTFLLSSLYIAQSSARCPQTATNPRYFKDFFFPFLIHQSKRAVMSVYFQNRTQWVEFFGRLSWIC